MYATTGISDEQFAHLAAQVRTAYRKGHLTIGSRSLPVVEDRVHLVLMYLRLNIPQQALAEIFHISQPTVCRLIHILGDFVESLVAPTRPTLEDIDPNDDLIVDGTLCLTWDFKNHPDNYSGKNHACGMTIQVACDLWGHLVWVSDVSPGCTHDAKALRHTGLVEHMQHGKLIGDRGYIGVCDITPRRKPPGGHVSEDDKAYNHSVNKIRCVVEQKNAHIKVFRCLSTPYRRPVETLSDTVKLVVGLLFYKPL